MQAQAASTFRLQMRSTMLGNTSTRTGPQGWTISRYSQGAIGTNQSLEISCRQLATNRVYHLMASWGTNGELIHVSDFMPSHSGTILMQYVGGGSHRFTGTDNPGQAWSMTGGWTNHMSWVIFPDSDGNDWCDLMHGDASEHSMGMTGGMGGMGGSNSWMGGSGGMGGMAGMDDGWPAMANWWSQMTNWWPTMGTWCWDYTNMWNAEPAGGGASSNWWGSLGRGSRHMMPLPSTIDAVPVINGLVVMDEHLQPVLSADLANPASFAYQTRCDLINQAIVPGAKGTLRASATQRSTHFALSATGLAPNTTYFMAINHSSVTPVATDRHGRLQIRKLPDGITSMRGIGHISIQDHDSNLVLSTTLPPG